VLVLAAAAAAAWIQYYSTLLKLVGWCSAAAKLLLQQSQPIRLNSHVVDKDAPARKCDSGACY